MTDSPFNADHVDGELARGSDREPTQDRRAVPTAHDRGGQEPPTRSGERMSLQHEATLSLDWETQLGGAEAERVDEVLRARHAATTAGDGDTFADQVRDASSHGATDLASEAELEVGLDRTVLDPANATLRGVESPLIAPKGGREAVKGERPSDDGFRFSGASMSFGQIVVVDRRNYPADAIPLEGTEPEERSAQNRIATRILVACGAAAMLLGIGLFALTL